MYRRENQRLASRLNSKYAVAAKSISYKNKIVVCSRGSVDLLLDPLPQYFWGHVEPLIKEDESSVFSLTSSHLLFHDFTCYDVTFHGPAIRMPLESRSPVRRPD